MMMIKDFKPGKYVVRDYSVTWDYFRRTTESLGVPIYKLVDQGDHCVSIIKISNQGQYMDMLLSFPQATCFLTKE